MAFDPENENKNDLPEDHTDPPWPEPAAYAPETAGDTADAIADAGDDSDAPIELADDADEADDSAADAGTPGMAGDVRAETVTISQGGANSVEAENVSITQGGAAQVRAGQLSVSQGGVALARTENLTVGESSSAFAVVADSATIEEGGNVFMLIARSVGGDVRPVLDWRAALAFGAGLAVVARLLRRR
jgi:hypothetical protein